MSRAYDRRNAKTLLPLDPENIATRCSLCSGRASEIERASSIQSDAILFGALLEEPREQPAGVADGLGLLVFFQEAECLIHHYWRIGD